MRQHWKIIRTIHDKNIFRLLIIVSSCATIKDNKHCVLDASEFRDNSLLKVATKLAKANFSDNFVRFPKMHRSTSPEDLLCPTKWLFFIGYFWSDRWHANIQKTLSLRNFCHRISILAFLKWALSGQAILFVKYGPRTYLKKCSKNSDIRIAYSNVVSF